MNKINKIYKNSLKEMKFILPIFFVAVLAGILIEIYMPVELVNALLKENLFLAIPLAAVIGIILPIPRYATYPIAFALFEKGAGFGVVFALISGEVICESIARDIVEIKFLGIKFFSARLILSVIFVIAGGFLIEFLL